MTVTDLTSGSAALSDAVESAMATSTTTAATVLARTQQVAQTESTSSWLGMIARLLLFILHILSTILYWSLKLTTISVPTLLFTFFSASLTVTMNATTLALILFFMFSGVTWVVRYRYLNMYSRLPPEPQRKEPELDPFAGTHEESTKAGLSNYVDEFLDAMKIFGYLERPVFHELTRSMQTRKLISGETLNLEEEKGFCFVVDGLVEIFVKSLQHTQTTTSGMGLSSSLGSSFSEDDDGPVLGQQRYQLLTEVRNGNPMSSLFSIMSLFTEDVRLEVPSEETSESILMNQVPRPRMPSDLGAVHDSTTPFLDKQGESYAALKRRPSTANQTDTDRPDAQEAPLPRIPPISLDDSLPPRPKRPSAKRMPTSVHPDIIARATIDTTIAIIPASAFRRLIKVYPKATSHIVHVILSRFQRVTLATAYNYLGLTNEVLQTEKSMMRFTTSQLPNILRGDALERLKEKFSQERERAREEEPGKGIALHNASNTGHRRRSSTSLRKEAALQAMSRARPQTVVASTIVPPQEGRSIHTPSPGDLLANVQIARSGGALSPGMLEIPLTQPWQSSDLLGKDAGSPLAQRALNPFTSQKRARLSIHPRESVDEDNLFRLSILECVFKTLGMEASGTSSRGQDSVEGSPRFVTFDGRRPKNVLSSNSAFGFMPALEGSTDWDSESVTSGGMSTSATPSVQALASEMKQEVEIVFFSQGSVLVEQGERSPGLYYVIDGFLDICVPSDDPGSEILSSSSRTSVNAMHQADSPVTAPRTPGFSDGSQSHRKMPDSKRVIYARRRVGLVKPGGIAGYISTVSSYRSFIDVVAKTDVYVGFIPRTTLEKIVDKYPIVLLAMAKRLTSLLPRLLLHIDFALEWVQVDAGQVIFKKDEESEAIYLVLNGRLRLVEDRGDGGMSVRAEFGQGDSVGELEVMTESTRSGTLHAIRDTELVKFPRTLFNSLAQEHPNITIKISKIIASRMRHIVDNPSTYTRTDAATGTSINKSSSTLNIRTVAILPIRSGVPVVEFGNRLMTALSQVGTLNGATSLNQSAILSHLGKHAFNKMGKLKLAQYLADLEEKYGLVVYVADTSVAAPWTRTCITQADCILLVGLAESSPEIGEYERFILGTKSTARKTLVLLHADRDPKPGLTRSWLKNRVWINGGHYHMQMSFGGTAVPVHPPSSARKGGPTLKERVQILQAEIQKYTTRRIRQRPYYSPDTPFKGDFQRLARRLCGKSIGLVLGGGGARGIAHIGVIKAIEEAGIPLDIVGGTSIGAFMGGLYARHADIVPMYGLAKKFAGRMSSMWRFALDLTYPSASYTTGHEFNRGIFKIFGKHQIEDFWLEFYCNTTNISKSRAEIHTSGYAWRYVRASMSLAGLLPPLCDEGSMLLDGGYIDNLTVSHMKSLGADIIFAVDVGSLDDDTPQSYGDTLSGMWAFFNRWNPLSSTPNPPTLAEIQGRLAYVSSIDALERAKTLPGCIYMRPPVDDYGTLDFGKFDEIYERSLKYGQDFLARLKEQGILPLVEEIEAKKALRRTMAPRRASI
ncbi:hypothetical protein NPX13_g1155 [Xylaria arbuscula]|uniref:Lysophospholipase NTE1 n=1 Tax=Xylaria arbuscula TaxID=114810 RepID=A0A9W8TPW6_9PEZI|nr:hypothetical protein NPX13_g1155 [Xylaria arbuscula]